jgi:FKBP-type peptidyl-prolyl cis-trans isomerase SlyD
MQIDANHVVGITYTLTEANQTEVIEKVEQENPFYFLFGAGNLLPAFEDNLKGLEVGNSFSFSLNPEEAYGPVDSAAIVDLPVSAFMVDGRFAEEHVVVGEFIQMQDQDGNPLMGKVVTRGLDAVTIDFNHPMAGKQLAFSGEVVSVRAATEDELKGEA